MMSRVITSLTSGMTGSSVWHAKSGNCWLLKPRSRGEFYVSSGQSRKALDDVTDSLSSAGNTILWMNRVLGIGRSKTFPFSREARAFPSVFHFHSAYQVFEITRATRESETRKNSPQIFLRLIRWKGFVCVGRGFSRAKLFLISFNSTKVFHSFFSFSVWLQWEKCKLSA